MRNPKSISGHRFGLWYLLLRFVSLIMMIHSTASTRTSSLLVHLLGLSRFSTTSSTMTSEVGMPREIHEADHSQIMNKLQLCLHLSNRMQREKFVCKQRPER
jgi:hypothetical protein